MSVEKSSNEQRADFEPLIIAFCCNWCSYAGADLAGTSRIQYPTNTRIVRVMCSGRVDPVFIFSAFKWGADGVLIAGCHPGDCHYVKGNLRAERRFEFIQKALDHVGIERERLGLAWVSASEGEKFSRLTKEMTEKIRALGPIPLKT
ncbi:MAG: hydrogenase iron-sulfur subunit [Candidatus Bathyarchaeia archaeon]